jgi:hypothetical protein
MVDEDREEKIEKNDPPTLTFLLKGECRACSVLDTGVGVKLVFRVS